LIFKDSIPEYIRYEAPKKAIIPTKRSELVRCDRTNSTTKIIGRSVIRGDTATFIPSHFPCYRVSEMVTARRGPGDVPAARPRKAPIAKYSIRPDIYDASFFT